MKGKALEMAARQTGSTVRNMVGGATASVKGKLSITGWANRLTASMRAPRETAWGNRDEGIYILSAEDVRRGARMNGESFITPDGYVRRSPVQAILVAPGYHRRMVMRGVLCGGIIAVLAAVVYALVRIGAVAF